MALNFNNDPKAVKKSIWDGLFSDENISSYLDRAFYTDEVDPVVPEEALAEFFAKAKDAPLSSKAISVDGLPNNSGLGATTALAGNWIKDNKLKSAGLLGAGAANVAGLFDNPNIIGQLAGLGGGFAAGKMLIPKLTKNPLTGSGMALATMGGGALGSLFDKLMANKDAQKYQEQYY